MKIRVAQFNARIINAIVTIDYPQPPELKVNDIFELMPPHIEKIKPFNKKVKKAAQYLTECNNKALVIAKHAHKEGEKFIITMKSLVE